MNNYYIYAYVRADGTPYYIGRGTKNRAYVKHIRKNGTNLTPIDKDKIKILNENLTLKESKELEIMLIAKYGRKDLGTGILRNLTDGGDGATNPSDSTRERTATRNKRLIQLGLHPWGTEVGKKENAKSSSLRAKKEIVDGTHNFLKPTTKLKVTEKRKQRNDELVKLGRHNFQTPEHRELVSNEQKIKIQNGNHNFIGLNKKRILSGTHNFLYQQSPSVIRVCCIHCHGETNLVSLSKHSMEYCPSSNRKEYMKEYRNRNKIR